MCNLLGFVLKKMLFKVPSNENHVFETVIRMFLYTLESMKKKELKTPWMSFIGT